MDQSVKMAIYQIGMQRPSVAQEAQQILIESNLLTENAIHAAVEGDESLAVKIDKIVSDEQYARFS